MNVNADGIMTRHMTDSLKSSTVSQEASTTTHNPSVHSLAIGSIRKYSHSQGTHVYTVHSYMLAVKDKD